MVMERASGYPTGGPKIFRKADEDYISGEV